MCSVVFPYFLRVLLSRRTDCCVFFVLAFPAHVRPLRLFKTTQHVCPSASSGTVGKCSPRDDHHCKYLPCLSITEARGKVPPSAKISIYELFIVVIVLPDTGVCDGRPVDRFVNRSLSLIGTKSATFRAAATINDFVWLASAIWVVKLLSQLLHLSCNIVDRKRFSPNDIILFRPYRRVPISLIDRYRTVCPGRGRGHNDESIGKTPRVSTRTCSRRMAYGKRVVCHSTRIVNTFF